jgi:hypothetical protein
MKPNWNDAPDWANWLAQDECGEWYWYEQCPTNGSFEWISAEESELAADGPETPNWRVTLEQRPRKDIASEQYEKLLRMFEAEHSIAMESSNTLVKVGRELVATFRERNNAWDELRAIREAINANPEESTLDEVKRIYARYVSLQNSMNDLAKIMKKAPRYKLEE